MVALSVSTSASESSDFTLSPTLKFHLLITPSVMVSLISGIRITAAGMLDRSTAGAEGAGAVSCFGAGAVGSADGCGAGAAAASAVFGASAADVLPAASSAAL